MARKRRTQEEKEDDFRALIQSIERAIGVLETLAEYPDGLGVTEISRINGLYKSTAHRILTTFVYHKYLDQDLATERYKLSYKIFEISQKIINNNHLLKVVSPFLDRIAEDTRESVSFVMVDKIQRKLVVCDERLSMQPVSTRSEVGRSIPIANDAATNVFFAGLTEDEISKLMKEREPVLKLDKASMREVKNRLHYIREAGYAIDWGEDENDITSIAAPIMDKNGEIVAILRLIVPMYRAGQKETDKYAKIIRNAAQDISHYIGYIG